MQFFDMDEQDNFEADRFVSDTDSYEPTDDDVCDGCDEYVWDCECDPHGHDDFGGGEDSFLDSYMESRMMGEC